MNMIEWSLNKKVKQHSRSELGRYIFINSSSMKKMKKKKSFSLVFEDKPRITLKILIFAVSVQKIINTN